MKHKPLIFAILLYGLALAGCQPKPVGGELQNTYWTVFSVKSGNRVTTLGDSSRIIVIFAEGTLSGIGTCNRYAGSYSTEDALLTVSDLRATERMCDDIHVENVYLQLLEKATGYSVLEDRLVIFSEGGHITCMPMPATAIKQLRYEEGGGKLVERFPPLDPAGMLHLFPIIRVDNPGNYPYRGSLIDPEFYRFFDDETREIWTGTGGDVMAVGTYGDLFIARIPGRYVSSDIALFRLEDDVMERLETVAWAWCDEGWCNQQDAWLTDYDRDGKLDIVQHYTLTDDKGRIREERLTVLLQDENGEFIELQEADPDPALFEMADI